MITLLFILLNSVVNGQVIPAHRIADWSVAGNGYDFSGSPGVVADVTSFGAVGDGVTDDFAAVSNAVNSFGGVRATLFFPPGTYLINGYLNLPDSITLLGSGAEATSLLFNSGVNNYAIGINGTASAGFITVEGGYSRNSINLTVANGALFSAGDLAEFLQDGQNHMTSAWAMESLGQIVVIDSVTGNELYLSQPIRIDYDSLLNPRIRRVEARKAVSVECLKIVRVDSTSSQVANIGFNYAFNCRLLGVESRLCNFAHVDIRRSSNITIRSCYFHEGHSYGSGGRAYGVCLHTTSGSCLIVNSVFRKLRHAMLLQSGANGNVLAYNYSTEPFWTDVALPDNSAGDIVLHGNYPYLNLFEGNIVQNIVIDDSHGKNGHHNTFFRNRAELYGIFMNNNPATDSVNFIGNEVTNTGAFMGLYYINGTNHFEHGNNIKGIITPAGTGSLSHISYYYSNPPDLWNISAHFPPIGPPNQPDIHINPAKARFLSGVNIASCDDTTFVNSVAKPQRSSNEFLIVASFFNHHNNCFELALECPQDYSLYDIGIYDILGVKHFSGSYTLPAGRNRLLLYAPHRSLSPGVHIVSVSANGVLKAVKVMRNQF